MAVTRTLLEERLADLGREVSDPRAGLFGPGSLAWRVNRESAVFLAGGRAALLQLAHPFVAAAIRDHSRTQDDVAGRFQRTFEHVYAMAFGDLDHALEAARRVHAIHERIVGAIEEPVGPYRASARYLANQPSALAWVHATLVDSALLAYERFVEPLDPPDRERYYQESKRFGLLFGLGPRDLPPDWTSFQRAFARTLASGTLAIGRTAAELAAHILSPPRPLLGLPMGAYRLLTTALLPPRFRDELHHRFGPLERAAYRALEAAIRLAYPRLPRRLRLLPAYLDAERRLQGEVARDPVGRAVDEALLWLLRRPAGTSPAT